MLRPAAAYNDHTVYSKFNLKGEYIQLIHARRRPDRIVVDLADLEQSRTKGIRVPASKHGLETICGASCETGAQ